jgi:hypothetical protein
MAILFNHIEGGDVTATHTAGKITTATIAGEPADARWIAGMQRLVDDDQAVLGAEISLTDMGRQSLRRAWPTAPALTKRRQADGES